MILDDHFEPSITGVLAVQARGPETGFKAHYRYLRPSCPHAGSLAVWTTAPKPQSCVHLLKFFRERGETFEGFRLRDESWAVRAPGFFRQFHVFDLDRSNIRRQ
jgi:hypothetical protein